MTDIYKQIKQYVVVHHSFDGELEYKQFSTKKDAETYMENDYVRTLNKLDSDEFCQIMHVGRKENSVPNVYIKVRKYDTIIFDSWHIIEILIDVPSSDCE